MTTMYGLARLGRDAEIRRTSNDNAVCNMALAFNYGRKGDDGKRPTQWCDAAMFGNRAESMAEYLTKGTLLMVTLRDVHVETYNDRDGVPKSKLVGIVAEIEFAGGPRQDGEQRQQSARPAAPAPAPRQQAAAPRQTPQSQGFSDMEDDIPFASACATHDMATLQQRRMKRYREI